MGHPSTDSFCNTLAEKYAEGAKKAGAEVKIINIGDLKFDPILHEGYKKIQKLEPDLLRAQKNISWAEHLVLIHPVWWGTMPALLKGLMDRIILPGFGFRYEKNANGKNNGKISRLLKGKSARLILTLGEGWLAYRILGRLAERIDKEVCMFCGIAPVKTTVFTKAETANDKTKNKWLKKIFLMGKNRR